MTSQKDQIQALITDIDSVLQKTTPRLPWVVSGEVTQQRQILERVRNYLVTFQRRQMAGEGFEQAGARPDLLAHDIYYQPAPSSYPSPQAGPEGERSLPHGQHEVAAQQMLQALVQEMGYLRSNLMQPLQSDVESLRQQREALIQEIHQLEAQRQGYAGALPGSQQQVIAEFLQALMTRLQETLPQQVAQSLRGGNQPSLPYGANLALTGSAPAIATTSDSPYPGFGNIQIAQSQSDELLIKLDSTLSVVFESLQRNVQAYEESLSQGLNKMHSLGQQGEMMFTALISHLASQLGQEASSYLQPPTTSRLESSRVATPMAGAFSGAAQTDPSSQTPVNPSFLEQPNVQASSEGAPTTQSLTLPFPGTELSSNAAAGFAPLANVAEPSVDTAIDSWLRSAGSVEGESTVDLEIAELNLEGFDLNQLAVQDVNALLELDANLLGSNLSPQPILAPEPPAASAQSIATEPPSTALSAEDTADIDAALKLLEQLSSELQDQPASVADAEAQIDRVLSSSSIVPGEPTVDSIPDDAKDELDEFYESLFGNQASAGETAMGDSAPAAPAITAPVNPQAVETPAVEIPAPETSLQTGQPVQASLTAETAIAPSAIQHQAPLLEALPSTLQPIDTLPAETQVTAEILAKTVVMPPSVSTSADPTLGWDLLAQPLADQKTEPEIPVALLEDELLEGWDLDDAEVDLATLDATPAGDDPLGISETTTPSDRPIGDFAVAPPLDLARTLGEPQSLLTEPIADAVPAVLPESLPATGAPQPVDEIATLTDLFDAVPSSEGLSLETPITTPVQPPSQSFVVSPASGSPAVLPVAVAGMSSPPESADDRVTDDRYTPASPEEDLLPLQEVAEESDPELWLDESTLTRLSEDLFNLEDAIGDPSILPYGGESVAEAPARFPDATASYEPLPSNDLLPLEDWNAPTDQGSDVLPSADTLPQSPPLPDQGVTMQPDVFILEGMDDLFANTPVEPPVVPIAPPVAPSEESSTAFTLEGMSNLFTDPLTDTAPPPVVSPPASQALPFTLEGMNDLFGDVPVVAPAPMPSIPDTTNQPLPFTLEGVDSLFADVEPVANALPVAEVATTAPLQAPSTPTSAFSFEQVGNLFVEVPSTGVPADTAAQQTIEPSLEPTSDAITPFTLEQVDGLFMERPSGATPVLEVRSFDEATSLAEPFAEADSTPFSLDQVGDLFADTPLREPLRDLTAPPILQPPSLAAEGSISEPVTTEPGTLEQAFASLMGAFDEPMPPVSDRMTDSQNPEKKKGMS